MIDMLETMAIYNKPYLNGHIWFKWFYNTNETVPSEVMSTSLAFALVVLIYQWAVDDYSPFVSHTT